MIKVKGFRPRVTVEWTSPSHSRTQVDFAGTIARVRAFDYEVSDAETGYLDVITNWRASHGYPLHIFQQRVRRHANACEAGSLVVHRLKRLDTLLHKLVRLDTLKLSRMQDIGGCRAVFRSVDGVLAFTERMRKARYKLAGVKNYIEEPKEDGYRGVHHVYQYQGAGRASVYNGLRIEVQARTALQHAWATAVEAVEVFTAQALKANMGSEQMHRFFALMGSEVARLENCVPVPNTPTARRELAAEIGQLARELRVREMLSSLSATVDYSGQNGGHYYLLRLDLKEGKLAVRDYGIGQVSLALEDYKLTEESAVDARAMVVLVSAESIADLRRAYPNYFLDMSTFLQMLDNATSSVG